MNKNTKRKILNSPRADSDKPHKVSFNPENCCWICEGWIEKQVRVRLKDTKFRSLSLSDNIKDEHYNIFIHFDFDNWDGDIMFD